MSEIIKTEEEKFKESPLGFLMSVIAKYQAYLNKNFQTTGNKESETNAKKFADILDNLKIELSKTESLKKENSNEAVLMHVIESCPKSEQEEILECVFEYLNLLDGAVQNLEDDNPERENILNEYYDVSRLGLLLNCYLGEFNNDDFFYGTLADMASHAPELEFSEKLISKIEKADIDLSFAEFLKSFCNEISVEEKNLIYSKMILPYSESLLNKVLNEEVDEVILNTLASAKQIQRIFEKF